MAQVVNALLDVLVIRQAGQQPCLVEYLGHCDGPENELRVFLALRARTPRATYIFVSESCDMSLLLENDWCR
jgi:hypothetical protein